MSEHICPRPGCENVCVGRSICKSCYRREYYLRNKERENAQAKAYYAANAELLRQKQADRRTKRPEYAREWYLANREDQIAKGRARREANPGATTKYSRDWRKRNPEKWALRNRENQHRRRAGGGSVDFAAILAEHGMVCHICGDAIATRKDLHFDHVIPLTKGGPHVAENIKPAHALCNMRKGDKIA